MKKLIFAVMAILAFGAQASAQTTTLTRFEGERIIGVESTGSIDVVLVKGGQTKAVMEIDRDLEQYLKLELNDGVVKVWLKDVPNNLWRGKTNSVRRLTLNLTEVHTVRMTGSGDLKGRGAFTASDVDIWRSGSGDIELDVNGSGNVKVQRSGSGDVDLRAHGVKTLTLMVAGSGELDVHAVGVGYTSLNVSGSGDVDLEGNSRRAEFKIAGSADVEAAEFLVEDLQVNVAGSADVEVNATGRLDVQLAGSGSVRYVGSPRINSNVRGSGSVKPLR